MNIHDIYRPILRFFRTKRMKIFQETFLTHSRLTILDVGGGMFNWRLLPEPPLDLTIVNIHLPSAQDCGVPWVVADGRHLPFRDHSFDIVFCNSVIEHLGTLENQKLFAKECQPRSKILLRADSK